MKAGGDQELCLAASPEGSYLFRPAVRSPLQPGGLDRERSAFAFSVNRADNRMKGRKRLFDKKRHPHMSCHLRQIFQFSAAAPIHVRLR